MKFPYHFSNFPLKITTFKSLDMGIKEIEGEHQDFPGYMAHGASRGEALAHANEALQLF